MNALFAAIIPPRPLSPEEIDRAPGLTHTLYGEEIWQAAIVIAVALALGAVIFLLMYLLRRRERFAVAADTRNPYLLDEQPNGVFRVFAKRHKRRRRRHRPRNPTLAETGGLPPPRNDRSPAPPT